MGNNINFKSDLPQALHTPSESGATVVEGMQSLEQGGDTLKFKAPTWMRNIALAALLLGAAACETDKTVDPIGQVEIKYKEYSVVPKAGEIYFTLPNGQKVIADGLVSFDVKENLTSGDRTVKLVFEGTKLKQAIAESINNMKTSYPNGEYSLALSFSGLSTNGFERSLTSSIFFVERHDKQIAAIGIDQLENDQKYTFEQLMKLGGNNGSDSGINILNKGEKLIGNVSGSIKTNNYEGYLPKTKITFEI